MTKRALMAASLAAVLAGGTAVAIAQSPQGGPGIHAPGGPKRGPRVGGLKVFGGDLGLRGVELTEAQREQVRTIMESHKSQLDQVGEKLRAAHRGFAEATRTETIDEAAIRARSAEIATAMAEEAILRAKIRTEVFGILTAEQQQKVKEQGTVRRPRR